MSATTAMLEGIKNACEAWGRAMRWLLSANGEGYPSLSSFERARIGDLDRSAVLRLQQRFGEVLTGDAQVISIALRSVPMMPEELHRVLFMHFVVPRRDAKRREITARQKAQELGYTSTRPYYTALEMAYHVLLGKITIEDVPSETKRAHTVSTGQERPHTENAQDFSPQSVALAHKSA